MPITGLSPAATVVASGAVGYGTTAGALSVDLGSDQIATVWSIGGVPTITASAGIAPTIHLTTVGTATTGWFTGSGTYDVDPAGALVTTVIVSDLGVVAV